MISIITPYIQVCMYFVNTLDLAHLVVADIELVYLQLYSPVYQHYYQ